MATETKKTTTEEKIGFFKKSWKTIVTGVVCAVVGGGVMVGADVAKIQDTITKAQARQVAIAAASYSAEQVISKIATISTAESKAKAVKEAIDATTAAVPDMIAAATTVKEAVAEAKENIAKAKEEAVSTTADTTAKTDTAKAAETK